MKIVVVGIGQCGSNLADAFYYVNQYAKSVFNRRIEIVTDAFAINSDTADLSGIYHIPTDERHRPIIGAGRTYGHGAGKDNVLGAKLMKESISVLDNVLSSRRYSESDAIVVMASAGGGTGSGGIGQVIEELKKRAKKPVYAILVLPFKYEEQEDLTIKNTAVCLNKLVNEARPDAIFLLDNQKLGKGALSVRENFKKINLDMVMNFYDLFCAGEEKNPKYVGGKVIDAGDIIKSLEGPSVIGRGTIPLKTFLRVRESHFRQGAQRETNVVAALQQANDKLGMSIKPQDARKLIWLFCAPDKCITLKTEQEITGLLREEFVNAEIRHGNYPRMPHDVAITLIASKLMESERLRDFFRRGKEAIQRIEDKNREAENKIQDLYSEGEGLPKI